jgi:hypothetical protein
LRPIKTGAARIALGAVSTGEVRICKSYPLDSTTLRRPPSQRRLLYFGKPIDVKPVELEANGELPREPVRELSSQIERDARCGSGRNTKSSTQSAAEKIFSSENESDEVKSSLPSSCSCENVR